MLIRTFFRTRSALQTAFLDPHPPRFLLFTDYISCEFHYLLFFFFFAFAFSRWNISVRDLRVLLGEWRGKAMSFWRVSDEGTCPSSTVHFAEYLCANHSVNSRCHRKDYSQLNRKAAQMEGLTVSQGKSPCSNFCQEMHLHRRFLMWHRNFH